MNDRLNDRWPLNYDSPKELRAFLDGRGLGMRKKFGQNFLINPAARAKLLDALELKPGDPVWEIGPGLGAMTAGLLERGGRVTAFEIDPAFAGILREFFASESSGANPAFRLVEGDVLKTWPAQISPGAAGAPAPAEELFLLGNLPYNIAAALLADFIEKGRFFKRIVVTVQNEVAQRMAARPDSPAYSSFSVLCSSVYKVSPLLLIKGASFYPAPNVDSRGVCLDLLPRREKLPELFYPLVRSLFSSRRKTIKNTLSSFAARLIMDKLDKTAACRTTLTKSDVSGGAKKTRAQALPARQVSLQAASAAAEVFARSGISGERRPETLGLEDFAALAAFLEEVVFHG